MHEVAAGTQGVPRDDAAARHKSWQRAQRHSRRVRRLRVVLPALGLVLALGLFVSFQSIPSPIGDIELSSIGVDGDTVTMEAPKLTGYGEQGLSYAVSADRAQQDLSSPNMVHLQGIDGRLDEEGGRWTQLRAQEGTLDTEAETLRLDQSIELTTNDGKRAQLKSANIDFSEQTVSSEDPVELHMDVGSVAAGSIQVSEGGKRIVLRGNVKVDMRMNGSLENALGTPDR